MRNYGMRRNFLILEDDEAQLEMLCQIVMQMDSDIQVYTSMRVADACRIVQEHTIDCFLVDIILDTGKSGDTSGAKFVQFIRSMSKYYTTPVLFITSLEDPGNYAYKELHCFDYIEKPFDKERIKANIRKVLQIPVAREADKTLIFRKDGILYPIRCEEICYIQNRNHVQYIHLNNQTVFEVQYRTCQDILEEADSQELFQCSRNMIVNRKYVYNIDLVNGYITLKEDGKHLPIGITFKKKVAELFKK